MGMLLFIIYLIEKVDVFANAFKQLYVISVFLFLVFIAVYIIEHIILWIEEEYSTRYGEKLLKWAKIALIISITSGIIGVLIPTKNFIYAAVGLKIGQELIQYKNINSMMEKSVKALELKLDSIIKDIEDDNIKSEIEDVVKDKTNKTVD